MSATKHKSFKASKWCEKIWLVYPKLVHTYGSCGQLRSHSLFWLIVVGQPASCARPWHWYISIRDAVSTVSFGIHVCCAEEMALWFKISWYWTPHWMSFHVVVGSHFKNIWALTYQYHICPFTNNDTSRRLVCAVFVLWTPNSWMDRFLVKSID